ncbi:MFS general substrate transporter [Parathielavia appendiculata]|uniref:MFS general substrate transporter n=1 Tax=Parathielavia appendiculata TaxID=2587402 RepID=A0AAN6TR91_9PEZI|nr:MFS general substrate transporter [Parathielavia appendiculata]
MDTFVRKIRNFWAPVDIGRDIQHVRGRQRREQRVLRLLDRIGFSWRVYSVAFLGFLASSWSLIATGIVSPALYFVYPPTGRMGSTDVVQVLDLVTLTATVLGMIMFGQLADLFGRKALYGFELLIVLAAIGGAAFSSEGYMVKDPSYHSSMDIYASLTWWRFTLGFGIGAEYPMSAVIAAEFSSTAGRGSLLAAVFLAQPIGRLLAYGLGLGILHGMQDAVIVPEHSDQNYMLIMDKFWRLVLGLAGIPAIFAIVLRLFIPETPRFYSAVQRDLVKAKEAVLKVGSRSPSLAAPDMESLSSDMDGGEASEQEPWRRRAYAYFFGKTQGWKPLLAVSLQWLLLDIVFYGTGLDSPGTLAALWLNEAPNKAYDTIEGFHVWKEDYRYPNATIVETLENNLVRTLQLSSIAAVVGSIAVIFLVNYVSRKTHYVWTTAALTILFAVTAVSVSQTYGTSAHLTSMVFYALGQFMFNLGPNTLTFILAAESFPTEFRGTCYGIAAAAGKVGAIIVRPITERVGKSQEGLVGMLSAFSAVLALMTLLAWLEPCGIGFPRVQEERDKAAAAGPFPARLANLSLEEAAPWPLMDDSESDHIGHEGDGQQHVNGGLEKGGAGVSAGTLGNGDSAPVFRLPEPSWGSENEIR